MVNIQMNLTVGTATATLTRRLWCQIIYIEFVDIPRKPRSGVKNAMHAILLTTICNIKKHEMRWMQIVIIVNMMIIIMKVL